MTEVLDATAPSKGVPDLAAVLLVSALVCAGCAGGASRSDHRPSASAPVVAAEAAPGGPQPAGTYSVGRTDRTYVDDSRPTAAHGGRPELPSRTLPTLVLYPAEGEPDGPGTEPVLDLPPRSGPWPLILFAHGSTRTAASYLPTLAWWASAGYVVAAPDFPLSTEGTPGGTRYTDYPSQTADESYLLDAVLDDPAEPQDLAGLVDADRIGLGGQSFGAITTLGTVASQCCVDTRVKAATEFAGMFLPYPSSGDALAPEASAVPVLFVHGEDDPTVPYATAHGFWERLRSPGGFLTIVGGGHDAGYFAGGTQPLDRLIADVTLAFYDQHLKGDPEASARLQDLITSAGPDVVGFEPS